MGNQRPTLPLAQLIPASSGEFDIGDAKEVYGDSLDLFPPCDDPCDFSPTGQCEYAGPNDSECKWCRKKSGLDR